MIPVLASIEALELERRRLAEQEKLTPAERRRLKSLKAFRDELDEATISRATPARERTMTEVQPTQARLESTHGIQIPVRADRSKGISRFEARVFAQRWRDRTDDIVAYLDDVAVPHEHMFIDAELDIPVFFRNEDGREVGRFPGSPTSPINLSSHPRYVNQGEDYDGDLDDITSDSETTVQVVITGAQRRRIQRAGKLDDLSLLPLDSQIKHPRNFALAREIRRRLTPANPPKSEHHG